MITLSFSVPIYLEAGEGMRRDDTRVHGIELRHKRLWFLLLLLLLLHQVPTETAFVVLGDLIGEQADLWSRKRILSLLAESR